MRHANDFTVGPDSPTKLSHFLMFPRLRLTGAAPMMTPDEFTTTREIRIMITLATAFLITSFALLLAIGVDTAQHTDAGSL